MRMTLALAIALASLVPGTATAQSMLELRGGAAFGSGDTGDVTDTGFTAAVSWIAFLGNFVALGGRAGYARLPIEDFAFDVEGEIETILVAPEIRVGALGPDYVFNSYLYGAPGYVHTEGKFDIPGFGGGDADEDGFGFAAGGALSIPVSATLELGGFIEYHRSDLGDGTIEFISPGVTLGFRF